MKEVFDASYKKDAFVVPGLTNLKPNKYYLYNADLDKLDIGPFTNIREVNETIGINADRQNLRWVNMAHLITAPLLGGGVYIVCNKVDADGLSTTKIDRSMKVQVQNHTTGETIIFSSMSKASIHIYGAKRGMEKIIRGYVITGKVYTYHGTQYTISYVNPTHLLAAKVKYGQK